MIELASDSYFAPSSTFVVPHDRLYDATSTICVRPGCGHLTDADGVVFGSYVMSLCVQSSSCPGGVGWNLGNVDDIGAVEQTALPVTATYRMIQDPFGDDVTSLGLPIEPVQAQPYIIPGGDIPGPQGGPSFGFQAYLQPGTYERTIVPDAPYDSVFAPEVMTVPQPLSSSVIVVPSFDLTRETGNGFTLPTFDIARADGLDGWSAYLRDATTLRPISNVRPLSGKLTQGVLLVTNHLPAPTSMVPMPDALTNAELVIQPPPGALVVPTGVFAPAGNAVLPAQETYPDLPQPVTLSGKVVSAEGKALAADMVFEALAIEDQSGQLNDTNFEFVATASAQPSTSTGDSLYSVTLPPGQYRVDVRPVDQSGAVTIVDLLVGEASPSINMNFSAGALRVVNGTAAVADGRPLSQATIEALPTRCIAIPAGTDAGTGPLATAVSSPSCLPRPGQTTSAADGSFALSLDPGTYILRARPADGTRLPWVTTNLTVQPSSTSAESPQPVAFTVPAPVSAGMQLFDPTVEMVSSLGDANPIVHAVVRAFALPPQTPSGSAGAAPAPAIEIGRAFTDVNGRFDLYLAPTVP